MIYTNEIAMPIEMVRTLACQTQEKLRVAFEFDDQFGHAEPAWAQRLDDLAEDYARHLKGRMLKADLVELVQLAQELPGDHILNDIFHECWLAQGVFDDIEDWDGWALSVGEWITARDIWQAGEGTLGL